MSDQPQGADAKPRAPTARIVRIMIEQQPCEVSVSTSDDTQSPKPSDFPLVVEVNRVTQSLEARRARYVSPAAAHDSGESANASPALQAVLTDREIQVLNELAKGASNKSIARSLGISTGTVRVHVKSVLRKLALDNRTQAAVWLTTANLEKR